MAEKDSYRAATAAIIDGRLDEAQAMLDRLVAHNDGDARAYMLLGKLAATRRDFAGEWAMLAKAVALAPAEGDYWAMLARCHARAQDMAGAFECADAAHARAPLGDVALAALASTYTQFGRHAEAAEILQDAVTAGSRNPAIHFNLGSNLKFTGDFVGARQAFEHALTLAPHYHKAQAALSALGEASGDPDNLRRIEAAIAATTDPKIRIHLSHAASKEYEAVGDYDAAWQVLSEGKAALRSSIRFHPQAVVDGIDAQMARALVGASPFVAEAPGAESPLFVVGMPRSGTTVMDRIVSNHSRVTSIGETLYFAQQCKQLAESRTPLLIDDAMIAAYDRPEVLHEAGLRYGERCHAQVGAGVRALDKFHLNFMLAGHLMQARPDARILCMVRDPLDTIVSNFRQLFEFETPLYHYALELEAAARMCVRFGRMARMWQALAPTQFKIVRYEDLVTDPGREAQTVLAFCGLDWEDGVTRIENNRASVATASAVQVRRPIHSETIQNWRRYERHLAPAIAILDAG